MIKVFIIANGSNDLYYSINKTILDFLNKINEIRNVPVYMFFKLVNCDPLDLWKKTDYEVNTFDKVECIKYLDGTIENLDDKDFFRREEIEKKKGYLMAPDLFLKKYLRDEDTNIVILSGHGGPFQCFLDMNISPAVSLNTINLCKRISNFKIDLLFLDMCAMNYIEVIYELLIEGNIDGIITYKNFAPYEGTSYFEFINKVVDFYRSQRDVGEVIHYFDLPLIYIEKRKLKCMDVVKEIQNKLVVKMVNDKIPAFDEEIQSLKESINGLVNENEPSKCIKTMPLNYMKYYLSDENERKLYSQFSYAKNNFWRLIVTNDFQSHNDYNPEWIILEKESLENIIYLHNSNLKQFSINTKLNDLIKIRGEDKYYKIQDISR